MFPIDPSLYGATLPQRDFATPFVSPFFAGQNVPQQTFPWHNLPQQIPWQNLPQQTIPWQNLQRVVPPIYPTAIQPHLPPTVGYAPPFMTMPFQPMAFNPYVQTGIQNMPFFNWQKPLAY